MLGEKERQQVVREWNRTEEEFPTGSVQEMFEEQVERRAEAVAVVFGGERVRYGELDRRAKQVARYLRGKGGKTESRVAICLDRGVGRMVGVVKVGGGYVPLGAGDREGGLRVMVEDRDSVGVGAEGKLGGLVAGVGRAGLGGVDVRGEAGEWGKETESNLDGKAVGV